MYETQRYIMHLYKLLVGPHLQHCCQAWRPHPQKHIDNIKKVQRKATRIISEISSHSYESRFHKCGHLSPELRMLHLDTILVFKMIIGLWKSRLIGSSNFWKICMHDVTTLVSLDRPAG